MTVSEFIEMWDKHNVSYTPMEYTYKGYKITKVSLYKIYEQLESIKLECVPILIQQYDINIVHPNIDYDQFNYDQQKFYNELSAEIPPNTYTNIIRININ